ncbi:hypothetical protein HN285_03025 [Acinetobacter baumannii]|uniref:hypothetical protein n=1 Tax=Acinetobacter baumannii TaxID=470 RepID=UPI0018977EFF|nr:hypothetical protein [Acinetobacter baumannii]MBF6745459.1 hypothetical protein [Acinetobacter baumannii]MBF6831582.1 hypothetical protein [Acinetobacter baumannii]MBF6839080.1 hypothetical protein [Acinetobacter baumannii]MBF6919824.1 hypothetical protein [Acinetobacter baumannii]MBF6929452.1 hypothetical protein [Acinetobacter baumannii]
MFQCLYKYKNQGFMCTLCTFMCTIINNGTRLQALYINASKQMCTVCTICAHARIRKINIDIVLTTFKVLLKPTLKKHSHVRELYINGTHGTHLSESFTYKGFPVFTFSKNHKQIVNMVHTDNYKW